MNQPSSKQTSSNQPSNKQIGSDTGGTFTDLVSKGGVVVKVLSTPDNPARAVASGLAQLGADKNRDSISLTHGTTVATNALLERKGARVALITNEGFADFIEIARQDRPSLYDLFEDRPVPLVARQDRLEVAGRLDATGQEIEAVDVESLAELPNGVEAVAICLLHSDLNPAHEKAVQESLKRKETLKKKESLEGQKSLEGVASLDITCSHEIAPEFREYERASTTVLNSYLRPLCRSYIHQLETLAQEVLVMTSTAGLLSAVEAAEAPVRLLLSGPAGGVRAATAYAVANGYPDAVTFDMGGTSTDVCLILGGQPSPAAQREIEGFPVRVMSLDVLTIGAGGGSIAKVDSGGALQVGPQSAGAMPGPACYGQGGLLPTVTDANLLLGRIPDDASLGDLGVLNITAAREAFQESKVQPEGVLAVVNTNMEQALRSVTTRRGVDPRSLALVAFGGAGPLHACDLAGLLGIDTVIVPPRAGVLSAVGILGAPKQVDLVQSIAPDREVIGTESGRSSSSAATRMAEHLRHKAQQKLPEATQVEVSFDCRYAGQSHELTVSSPGEFHSEHYRQNGYSNPDAPVETTAVRCTARVGREVSLPPAQRDLGGGVLGGGMPDGTTGKVGADSGTALAEADTTIWIPADWEASLGAEGSLVISKAS